MPFLHPRFSIYLDRHTRCLRNKRSCIAGIYKFIFPRVLLSSQCRLDSRAFVCPFLHKSLHARHIPASTSTRPFYDFHPEPDPGANLHFSCIPLSSKIRVTRGWVCTRPDTFSCAVWTLVYTACSCVNRGLPIVVLAALHRILVWLPDVTPSGVTSGLRAQSHCSNISARLF